MEVTGDRALGRPLAHPRRVVLGPPADPIATMHIQLPEDHVSIRICQRSGFVSNVIVELMGLFAVEQMQELLLRVVPMVLQAGAVVVVVRLVEVEIEISLTVAMTVGTTTATVSGTANTAGIGGGFRLLMLVNPRTFARRPKRSCWTKAWVRGRDPTRLRTRKH